MRLFKDLRRDFESKPSTVVGVHVQLPLQAQTLRTQSTEVHSQITQVHRGFLQVEGRLMLAKFSLKVSQAVNPRVSRIISEETTAVPGCWTYQSR